MGSNDNTVPISCVAALLEGVSSASKREMCKAFISSTFLILEITFGRVDEEDGLNFYSWTSTSWISITGILRHGFL